MGTSFQFDSPTRFNQVASEEILVQMKSNQNSQKSTQQQPTTTLVWYYDGRLTACRPYTPEK